MEESCQSLLQFQKRNVSYKTFSSSQKMMQPGYTFFFDMVSIIKAGRKGGNEVV